MAKREPKAIDIARPYSFKPNQTGRPLIPSAKSAGDRTVNQTKAPGKKITILDEPDEVAEFLEEMPELASDAPTQKIEPKKPPKPDLPKPEAPKKEEVKNVPKFGALQSKIDAHPLFSGAADAPSKKKRGRLLRLTLWPLFVLLLVSSLLYAAVDSGVINTNINLPYHFFNQTAAPDQPTIAAAKKADTTTIPADFKAYELKQAGLSFYYPTIWGDPAAVNDPGFSKRGDDNKSTGTYAYIINFNSNKNVQAVITSSKFLPTQRTPLYYDYLKWCVGSSDAKFYKSVLKYTSDKGVDSPTTITCDNGPLGEVSDRSTGLLIQTKTKNPDGTLLGDLYTKNLDDPVWAVLRVRDISGADALTIKQMLGTVQIANSD